MFPNLILLLKWCCTINSFVWFCLVWFYGISTFVGYLIPNPFLYISSSSSSSSCHAISTNIPDPFSPPFSIVHCFQQVFKSTSRIGTYLLYLGSSWSSCFCSSMWSGPQEYITYEFVFTSPAVSRMSGSSNFDSFLDGWYVVRAAAALWGAAFGICSMLLAAFLCICRQVFSPYVLLASM